MQKKTWGHGGVSLGLHLKVQGKASYDVVSRVGMRRSLSGRQGGEGSFAIF